MTLPLCPYSVGSEYRCAAPIGSAANPVIGVPLPQGVEWRSAGTWPSSDTSDKSRRMDSEDRLLLASPEGEASTQMIPRSVHTGGRDVDSPLRS